ncbi:YlaH-like family protein [Rubeoparvulum massiliense]|uniref:YlaH-like family protein n=1 Tax=Rubeoparvulum massiliense TaxID=1631346 RepID=UPI00065E4745|nr:YlaH-like family protein [Rubeoparvulum massiliense]
MMRTIRPFLHTFSVIGLLLLMLVLYPWASSSATSNPSTSFNWQMVQATVDIPNRVIEVSGVPDDTPLQIILQIGTDQLRLEEATGGIRQFTGIDPKYLQDDATLQFELKGHAYLYRFSKVYVTADQIKQKAIVHGPSKGKVTYQIHNQNGELLLENDVNLNSEGILKLDVVELLEGKTVEEGSSIEVIVADDTGLKYHSQQYFTISWIDRYAFLIIVFLSAMMYHLGFAKRLPILKTLIIYLLLIVGCIPLIMLRALGLPIISALSVGVAILLVYRIVRKRPYFSEQVGGL